MMMTRMSDDRDDHITRSMMTPPATRENLDLCLCTYASNDSTLVITLFFILLFIFYIFSDETVVNNRIDFVFTFRVERNDDTQQGSRLSG